MGPDLSTLRRCGVVLLLFWLAACTTTPETPPEAASSELIEELSARLPGEYSSVASEGESTQRLVVQRTSPSAPGRIAFRMRQDSGPDDPSVRLFRLELSPSETAARLDGTLTLLEPGGQSRRSCPMTFRATGTNVIGETDPSRCRFGQGSGTVGLLKEFAFDGRSLVIGDRILELDSGEARGADQVIRFLPAPEFAAWAGVREGSEWRVAEAFVLVPGPGSMVPNDAAEMALGLRVRLGYYRLAKAEDRVMLRLTVSDSRTGEVLGETWTEPTSARLGIALPRLQIGISRPRRPQSCRQPEGCPSIGL